jgi:hypothetical protein
MGSSLSRDSTSWHAARRGIGQVASEPTLYIERRGEYTPKGEVGKIKFVLYPSYFQKETSCKEIE